MGLLAWRTLVLILGAAPIAGCGGAPKPKLGPSDPARTEEPAIAEAQAALDRGLASIAAGEPPATTKAHAEAGLAALRSSGLASSFRAAALYDLLGRAEYWLGNYAMARAALLQEIARLRENNAQTSRDMARALTHLGRVYSAEGETAEAERLLREAMGLHGALSPTDHEGLADALIALADMYSRSGRLSEAVESLVQSAGIAQQHEPALAKQGYNALDELSKTYWAIGRRDAALNAAERGLALGERNPGDDLVKDWFLIRLSEWYKTVGRAADAIQLLDRYHLVVRSLSAGQTGPESGDPAHGESDLPSTRPPEKRPPGKGGEISNAASVVAEMRPGFRGCYQRALDRDRDIQGSVRLAIRVTQDGTIGRVMGVTRNLPVELVDCILYHAIKSRFEPPRGGKAVVNVPINLFRTR